MTTIYVVLTYVDHEGSEMVRAFSKYEAAQLFREQCVEYQKSEHNIDDLEAWLDAHPAGQQGYAVDGYVIRPIELD